MPEDVSTYPVVENAQVPVAGPQDPAQDEVATLQLQSTEALRSEVAALSESVRLLSAQGDAVTTASVVCLDDSQWAWAQGAVRTVCSSLLVVVIFTALACGIAVWRIVSDGWR